MINLRQNGFLEGGKCTDKVGPGGCFWNAGNIPHLDLGSGYTCVQINHIYT